MINSKKIHLLSLAALGIILGANNSFAAESKIASIDGNNLPINSATPEKATKPASAQPANSIVSPSKPQSTETKKEVDIKNAEKTVQKAPLPKENEKTKDDFDFDLKMKAITPPSSPSATPKATEEKKEATKEVTKEDLSEDLPKDIKYKSNPIENLGNSVLSQMDDDLFKQMSDIEKSTTLLTLELKREKIRNEIEAQKAIRQKNIDDIEKQKAEQRMLELQKKKELETEVINAKQHLLDREQMFEVLKQRKLLNAYMNHLLVMQQDWLKEKEALYGQLAAMEQEKRDLIAAFKQRIDSVLEASAKNIQVAEAAKANFERVVKNLKARNEQLRKRVEADAKIIKNAKNMYIQSQSIEELKDMNAANRSLAESNAEALALAALEAAEEEVEEVVIEKLSTKYALLGISGRAESMSVELIGTDGQPFLIKVGSLLPTGHTLKEIGSDYAKFSKDGYDDYLYIGKTIDGYTPLLGQASEKNAK